MMKSALLVGSFLAACVNADVYMHNPKGSNNRLAETSANRNNGNRLFDSQNNNRGGYNVGDKTMNKFDPDSPFSPPAATFDASNLDDAMQYQMVYFEGSELSVEWTAQHGCGGSEGDDAHKLNCNMVLQYMCDTDDTVTDPAMSVMLKDGGNTGTPGSTNDVNDIEATTQANDDAHRGRHESESHYLECNRRSRNKGLFIADQNVKGSDARYTRQNPNANRRGLECPEERDYYPYWSPSPWKDVAYLTDSMDKCELAYNGSQNNNTVYKCTAPYTDPNIYDKLFPITMEDCTAAGGEWKAFNHGIGGVECEAAAWSRVNHLGNGRDGRPLTYNWTLPRIQEMGAVKLYDNMYAKCVVRLRYNISTDDYDPWNTDWASNHKRQEDVISPVTQNPTVDVGANLQGLRLAINTAQFGRTFQDRSHVFYVKQRPAAIQNQRVVNLNVRGKRGNIVQTFPSVEYDFVPQRMHINEGDLVHVQWTGSNTHNNGNPAGDGQAGDAGEGTGGTDRSNIVQIESASDNFPIPLDKFPDNMWTKSKCYDQDLLRIDSTDCALLMATSGQFRATSEVDDSPDVFSPLLNYSPASLVGGVVMSFDAGDYHYMCSRNNNFSNRSQKASLVVEPATPAE